jgi:hypothetical protein
MNKPIEYYRESVKSIEEKRIERERIERDIQCNGFSTCEVLAKYCELNKVPKPHSGRCPYDKSKLEYKRFHIKRYITSTFGDTAYYHGCKVCDYEYAEVSYESCVTQCFIATAAYGTELDPRLDILRTFRDQVLLPNPIGNKFVELYYKYSPPIADLIRPHESIRAVIRVMLKPIISAAERRMKR